MQALLAGSIIQIIESNKNKLPNVLHAKILPDVRNADFLVAVQITKDLLSGTNEPTYFLLHQRKEAPYPSFSVCKYTFDNIEHALQTTLNIELKKIPIVENKACFVVFMCHNVTGEAQLKTVLPSQVNDAQNFFPF